MRARDFRERHMFRRPWQYEHIVLFVDVEFHDERENSRIEMNNFIQDLFLVQQHFWRRRRFATASRTIASRSMQTFAADIAARIATSDAFSSHSLHVLPQLPSLNIFGCSGGRFRYANSISVDIFQCVSCGIVSILDC